MVIVCVSVHDTIVCVCVSACVYTLVRVWANAARLSYFQVHVSLEGINWCKLSDSFVVFVQPLMQRRRRSGDKWEVVSQSVFISLSLYPSLYPTGVRITPPLSFSQHTLLHSLLCLNHSDATGTGQQRGNVLPGEIIPLFLKTDSCPLSHLPPTHSVVETRI